MTRLFVPLLLCGGTTALGVFAYRSRRRYATELSSMTEEAIRAFVRTIDAKSPYTARHSERVAAFARLLAAELGYHDEELDRIMWAALLHDVGKVAIPDEVLNKPGPLTDLEWEIVKAHPLVSVRIVEGVRRFAPLLGAIRHHHEWLNGGGYPDGARGEEISRDARVLAVADAFEAMTAERPYRPAMSPARALGELRSRAGTQFDPEIVEALARALGKSAEAAVLVQRAFLEHPASPQRPLRERRTAQL